MNPEWLAKQIQQLLYVTYIWYVSIVGMALQLKRVIETNLIRVS